MRLLIRQLRRLIIAVVGITVVLIGIAMIVLPGPAVVVIPFGLSILALEFAWAKRLLDRVKETAARKMGKVAGRGADDASGDEGRRAS
jgi:tellurite resistance protein TerC